MFALIAHLHFIYCRIEQYLTYFFRSSCPSCVARCFCRPCPYKVNYFQNYFCELLPTLVGLGVNTQLDVAFGFVSHQVKERVRSHFLIWQTRLVFISLTALSNLKQQGHGLIDSGLLLKTLVSYLIAVCLLRHLFRYALMPHCHQMLS